MNPSIYPELADLPVVDVHEHLTAGLSPDVPQLFEDERITYRQDIFMLFAGYVLGDIISAGMTRDEAGRLLAPNGSLPEKWGILSKYNDHIRQTAYYKNLISGIKEVVDFDDGCITKANWKGLCDKYSSAVKLGFYQGILQDKHHVGAVVLDVTASIKYKPELFTYSDLPLIREKVALENVYFVLRMLDVVPGSAYYPFAALEKDAIQTLSHIEDNIKKKMDTALHAGMIGIKYPLAYVRSLCFSEVEQKEASGVMDRLPYVTASELKKLQDYLVHYSLACAESRSLPVEFHTGILAGPWSPSNRLEDTNPLHLTNLFHKYGKLKFLLMHGGYPYVREAGILAKSFPNVYLESSWLSTISPRGLTEALRDWLELVPSNKILYFGGDAIIIEEAVGALKESRQVLASVLDERISGNRISREDALGLAKKLFYENACDFFEIPL